MWNHSYSSMYHKIQRHLWFITWYKLWACQIVSNQVIQIKKTKTTMFTANTKKKKKTLKRQKHVKTIRGKRKSCGTNIPISDVFFPSEKASNAQENSLFSLQSFRWITFDYGQWPCLLFTNNNTEDKWHKTYQTSDDIVIYFLSIFILLVSYAIIKTAQQHE